MKNDWMHIIYIPVSFPTYCMLNHHFAVALLYWNRWDEHDLKKQPQFFLTITSTNLLLSNTESISHKQTKTPRWLRDSNGNESWVVSKKQEKRKTGQKTSYKLKHNEKCSEWSFIWVLCPLFWWIFNLTNVSAVLCLTLNVFDMLLGIFLSFFFCVLVFVCVY